MAAKTVEQLLVEVKGDVRDLDAKIELAKKEFAELKRAGSGATVDAGKGADSMGEKFGRSARQVAMATEQMARLGKVTGESAKQIIAQGSEMALFFGPQGAIVGAIGIATLAIVEMFQRSRKEIEETRKKFQEEIDRMVNAGDSAGLMNRAAEIWAGTAAKHFKDGLAEAEREIASLREGMRGTSPLDQIAKASKIREIEERIKPLREAFDQVRQAILDINNTPLVIRGFQPVISTANRAQTPAESAAAAKRFADEQEAAAKRVAAAAENARLTLIGLDAAFATLAQGGNVSAVQSKFEKAADAIRKLNQEFAHTVQKQLLDAKEKGLIKAAPLGEAPASVEQDVLKIADAWATVGRSVIAAAQAIGEIDAETAAALQNVVSLGEGIVNIFGGDPLKGTAQALTSIGALVAGLFSRGPSPEEVEQLRTLEANTKALQDLVRVAQTGELAGALGGLSARKAGLARSGVEALLAAAGGSFATAATLNMSVFLTPAQIRAIEEAARAMGITLDGTRDAFTRFVGGLEIAQEEIEKAHARQQAELAEDYEVRRLLAIGREEEANALAERIARQRELNQLIEDGADEATIAAAKAALAAESARDAAEAAREAARRNADADIELYDITDPQEIARRRVKGFGSFGGSFGQMIGGFNLDDLSPENIARWKDAMREFWEKFKESPEAFDLAGLSVDEFTQLMVDFDRAIDNAADTIADAAQKIYRSSEDLDAYFDVHETALPEQITKKAQALGVDFDFQLDTQAGRDAALKWLTGAFDSALNAEEAAKYRTLIGMIRRLPAATGPGTGRIGAGATAGSTEYSVASEIRTITVEQGGRMLTTMTAQLATLIDIKALLAALAPVAVSAPFVPAFAGSGGPISISITIHQAFYGPVGQVDRIAAASFADLVYDELNRRLGLDVQNARLLKGDVTQR